MVARSLRLALVAAISAGTAACGGVNTFTYTVDRYGRTAAVPIVLGCRDTYEVADRAEAFTMLVTSNALNETLVACFDNGPSLADRQRQAARLFLDEKAKKPLCKFVGETEITLLQREFSYRCPPDPSDLPPRLPATPRRG